jgi:hypothetical protein
MLMTRDRRPAIRTLRGWASGVLQEAGAIRECEARPREGLRRRPRESAVGDLATGGCRGSRRSARFDR